MADGKPISSFEFSQEPDAAAEVEEIVDSPSPAVVEGASEDRREQKLKNELLADGHWSEEPYVADQEARFPGSVKIHAVYFKLFNVSDDKHMKEYSQLHISDSKQGRFIFDSPEHIQWDLPNARCFILVRVVERKFLALTTSNSNPNEN